MLNELDVRHLQSLGDDEAAQHARRLIERLSVQLKFEKARNTALSIEVARLKQWRFGKSSESMDAHQGELFDAKTLVALKEESQAEDRAQDEARSPKAPKRQAKRQALPSQPVSCQG
jgi:hypothetical protein